MRVENSAKRALFVRAMYVVSTHLLGAMTYHRWVVVDPKSAQIKGRR